MRGVHRPHALQLRAERRAEDLPKAVAAVADGQQREAVLGPGLAPADGDGFGGGLRGEGALELVRGDENAE